MKLKNFLKIIFLPLVIISFPLVVSAASVSFDVISSAVSGGGIGAPMSAPAPPSEPSPPPASPPQVPEEPLEPPLMPEEPSPIPPAVSTPPEESVPAVPSVGQSSSDLGGVTASGGGGASSSGLIAPIQNILKNISENFVLLSIRDTSIIIFNQIKEIIPESVKQVAKVAQETIRQVRKNPKVQKTMAEPTVDVSVKITATVAVGTAVTTGATSLMPLATFTSTSDFTALLFRIFSIFTFGIFQRKRKNWGVVYDAITKQPLDPAYVILKDKNGKEVDTRITDMRGRFGFLVPPGEYYIEANKTHYQFPSQKIMAVYDELYDNIYHGEMIKIGDASSAIMNIPMDPLDFDWNEMIKKNYVTFNYKWELFKRWFPEVMFLFGFLVAIITWVLSSTLFNQVIIWFFIALWVLRKFGFKKKNWGLVLDKKTKKPIPLASLKVFYEKLSAQIHSTIVDPFGRYLLLVDPGKYDVLVEEKTDGKYKPLEKYQGIKAPSGVLNKDLFVNKDEIEILNISGSETNGQKPPVEIENKQNEIKPEPQKEEKSLAELSREAVGAQKIEIAQTQESPQKEKSLADLAKEAAEKENK